MQITLYNYNLSQVFSRTFSLRLGFKIISRIQHFSKLQTNFYYSKFLKKFLDPRLAQDFGDLKTKHLVELIKIVKLNNYLEGLRLSGFWKTLWKEHSQNPAVV